MKTLTLATALAALPAMAAANCAPYEIMQQVTLGQLEQTKIFEGVTTSMDLLEIYANDKGQWLLIGTNTDMISCILDGGEHFEAMDLVEGLEG